MYRPIVFTGLLLVSTLFLKAQQNVTFLITENKVITPANIRITNEAGDYFYADSTYYWTAFWGKSYPDYPSSGQFTIKLPVGKYTYEIDRGPEYKYTRGEFDVIDKNLSIAAEIERIIDLKKLNWWSGELHIHRKLEHIERLMLAGDLHIGPVITSWNQYYGVKKDSVYNNAPKKFDNNRYYTTGGAEDERAGGAILVLNTPSPLNISVDHRQEYPPLAKTVERIEKEFGKNYWIDLEKPFWRDLPILIPTGKINSMGIAHNHMNKYSIFEGEANGHARDTAKYPWPNGNGNWTQDIYYNVLNAGIRIPPSAGSASGVLMNPVGYNRVYAHVEKDFTYEHWFEEVRAGRTFVTNGPLLICKANGKYPGEIFTSPKKMSIKINADIYSRDSIDFIEIIKNGQSYKKISPSDLKGNKLSETIQFENSGWFIVRVFTKTPYTFRFASTAPYYVEVGKNKKYISKSAVQFFLDWIEQYVPVMKGDNENEQAEISKYIDTARKYWQDLLSQANNE